MIAVNLDWGSTIHLGAFLFDLSRGFIILFSLELNGLHNNKKPKVHNDTRKTSISLESWPQRE